MRAFYLLRYIFNSWTLGQKGCNLPLSGRSWFSWQCSWFYWFRLCKVHWRSLCNWTVRLHTVLRARLLRHASMRKHFKATKVIIMIIDIKNKSQAMFCTINISTNNKISELLYYYSNYFTTVDNFKCPET